MWNEYRKHIRALFASILPLLSGIFLCFVIWDVLFDLIVMPSIAEYHSLEEIGYNNVIVSSKQAESFPSLWKLDNLVTYKNNQGKRLNTNNYIQLEHGFIPETLLGAREIAVSEKMAEKLDLSVGSEVLADYAIVDEPIEYSVRVILPYLSDLYETSENRDFSFAVVGFDEELFTHTRGHFVYFLDEQTYNEFMSSYNAYSEKYDIKKEVLLLQNRQLTLAITFSVILIIAFLFISIYVHRIITSEVVKYYRDGFSPAVVRRLNCCDHTIFLGAPVIIEVAWMAYYQFSVQRFLFSLTGSSIALMLVVFFLGIAGGRKYGQANHF